MTGETVISTSSRALLAACERLGLDVGDLLAEAGLTAAQVGDPDGRLPSEAVSRLWAGAIQRSGDPAFGLSVALAVPFGAYRINDFLAASAATVGEGLVRVARYFPLINSALAWEITEEPAQVRVALTHPGAARGLPRPQAEYAIAVTIIHCRRASGFDWPMNEVGFAFSPPPSSAEHVRTFGCAVRFGRPRNEFVLARATWDRPTQAPSTDLLRALEEHADRMIAGLRPDRPVAAQVARLVGAELQGGDPSLARIARRLAMSPRTLQRRLELESSSFADVLDETRRHLAQGYVQQGDLTLTEVAYLLGFSEQSAFTRAFQRWYGAPPSHYRARGAAALL